MKQKLKLQLSQWLTSSKAFVGELSRLGWPIAVALLSLLFIFRSGREIFVQQIGVLAWKLIQVGAAVAFAHFMRQQLFPYVDLEAMLNGDDPNAGRVFLGMCLFTAAVIMGLCQGL